MTDRSDPFRGRSFAYRTFARRRPCPRATYCSFTPAHGEHPPVARAPCARAFVLPLPARQSGLPVGCVASRGPRTPCRAERVRPARGADGRPPAPRFCTALYARARDINCMRRICDPAARRTNAETSAHFPSAAVHPPACSERFCLLCERRKSRRTACKASSPPHLLLRRKSVRSACFFPPPPRRNFFGEK